MSIVRTAFAALIAVLLLATAAAAATFTDPTGDVVILPTGADLAGAVPIDLTGAEITNTPDGLVTVRITLASTQPLSPNSFVGILIDTDKDTSTGDEGFEALPAIFTSPLGGIDFELQRYDGEELAIVDDTAATGTYANGVVTLTVPRRELFDTRGFAFGIVAGVFNANFSALALDSLPDGDELLSYDLVGLEPPAPPRLMAGTVRGTPAKPKAGKVFVASTRVAIADGNNWLPVPSGSVTCDVRVGGARLRAAGRLASSTARCTMTVPRSAKGKVLRGRVTIRHAGATVTRTFRFVVG